MMSSELDLILKFELVIYFVIQEIYFGPCGLNLLFGDILVCCRFGEVFVTGI